ncbi:MAG TPA: inorganic diphosphatase [Roseiflexaceae bacterium]|nr:inorganic diphosphatase [Roseiflexaceae bacterium]
MPARLFYCDDARYPVIQVLIQVGAGSCDKHVYNEHTLEFLETRRSWLPYPYAYGFVLGTRAADGDCVDCYVLATAPLAAGAIVVCEPIGLLEQDEDGEVDHKVLAALPNEEVVLGGHLLQEFQRFIHALFAQYPDARIRVGPIRDREAAAQYLQQAWRLQSREREGLRPSQK